MQPRALACISASIGLLAFSTAAPAQQVATQEHYAAHVSTLAANAGQKVALHVHREIAADQLVSGRRDTDHVVLFVHGATVPGTAAAVGETVHIRWEPAAAHWFNLSTQRRIDR